MILRISHGGWNHIGSKRWRYQPYINGLLARYVKLRVAHAPGMPGTFSPLPWVSDPDTHHGTCVTYVPWCMPESLYSSSLWIRWRGKLSRHSRRMRNPQFYVSGKRPMAHQYTRCLQQRYQMHQEACRIDSGKPGRFFVTSFWYRICNLHTVNELVLCQDGSASIRVTS